MSLFRVSVIARNPKNEELATPPIEAMVDSGSELTWLPGDVLRSAGITPRRKRLFGTATQQKVERDVGFAIVAAEGYETIDEVVFAEPNDVSLLGVRTLEGFGVIVDYIAHRFVATTTIVATVPTRAESMWGFRARAACGRRPANLSEARAFDVAGPGTSPTRRPAGGFRPGADLPSIRRES